MTGRIVAASLVTLFLVVGLLVSGFSAPVAAPDPPSISVENGSLRVDPGLVFVEVERTLGTDVPPPTHLTLGNPPVSTRPITWYWEDLGLGTAAVYNESERDRRSQGVVTGLGEIVLDPAPNAARDGERVLLAHELVHYVQRQNGRQANVSAAVETDLTDGRWVSLSIIEGAAVYTTDTYLARVGANGTRNSARYRRTRSDAPSGHATRLWNGAYLHGAGYMADRIDDPAELPAVYDRPPRTSEQVLHGLPPGVEPPAPLSVTVEPGSNWTVTARDRLGEAFVRTFLEVGLEPERAARAAAGWGNDTLRIARSGPDDVAYVWVLRWDDAANASEFEAALRASLDGRADRVGDGWRLEAVDGIATVRSPTDRTTVLLYGDSSFVEAVSVAGEDGTVRIARS